MPYKSQAQAAYFNTHRAELERQGVDVNEWNSASKGMKLPKHAQTLHKVMSHNVSKPKGALERLMGHKG